MSENEAASTSEHRSTTHRRYWRRTDDAKAWWPGGLLPAVGLLALFLFGALVTAPGIEADVRAEVADRLEGSGIVVEAIDSDGQSLRIAAREAPDREDYVQALAGTTRCRTWAGPLTCPTVVDVSLEPVPQAAPVRARPHAFTIMRQQGAVTLTGEVPTLEERERIVAAAGAHFDIVNDSLSVSNETATPNYSRAADRALAVVAELDGGQADWSGESLSVRGTAQEAAVDAAYQQYTAMGSGTVLGAFDVRAAIDPDACNDRFAEILGSSSIRFRTGSAEIDSGNEALLQRLAEQADSCPGNLTVIGHTDSQGDADMNQALSEARAQSVRDALAGMGIDAGRLSAVGFGESQPVADNSTADGRAKNRRIVITVDDPN